MPITFAIIKERKNPPDRRAIYLAEKHQLSAIGFNAKEIKGSFALKTNLREYLARGKAFLDVVLKKGPKFLGPTIRIEAQWFVKN